MLQASQDRRTKAILEAAHLVKTMADKDFPTTPTSKLVLDQLSSFSRPYSTFEAKLIIEQDLGMAVDNGVLRIIKTPERIKATVHCVQEQVHDLLDILKSLKPKG